MEGGYAPNVRPVTDVVTLRIDNDWKSALLSRAVNSVLSRQGLSDAPRTLAE